MALESWLQYPTCKPQHWGSCYMVGMAGQPFLGGRNQPCTLPRDLEALETVRKEAWGHPLQHTSQESSSAVWMEVGDTPGPTEAPRSWAAPFRSLTGGWPGLYWVHSELGTARGVGHPSTAEGREHTGEVLPRKEQRCAGPRVCPGLLLFSGCLPSQGPLSSTPESARPLGSTVYHPLRD